MNCSLKTRIALRLAVVAIAGCGQQFSGFSAAEPRLHAAINVHVRAKGRPTNGDLIYFSYSGSGVNAGVGVYTFSDGKLVGTWSGTANSLTGGECADGTGNVFVTLSLYVPGTGQYIGEILKFAHGDTMPTATLKDSNAFPVACSVDPTSGNLAVVDTGGASTLEIYRHASGEPTIYTDPGINLYGVTYDEGGNAFVDGFTLSQPFAFNFAELPKGSNSFQTITLDRTFIGASELQWDGKYIALGEARIYRIAVHGSSGRVVGSTRLKNLAHDDVTQTWVAGNHALAAWFRRPVACGPEGCGTPAGPAGVWNYPSGDLGAKSVTGQVTGPTGVALSVPASR